MKRSTFAATRRAAAAAILLGGLVLAAPPSALAAGKSASIEGVWKLTGVEVTGANPLTIASPQPNLYIFTKGHYSNVADTGRTVRTEVSFKDPAKPTDAEKLAKYDEWGPVAAQAGSYELKGNTLIRHPIAAKNVAALSPTANNQAEIKLSGDTLVIISHAQPGQPAREQRLTLTRVK